MIPIGDSVQSRTFPFVNVTIIALNVLIFLYELTLSTSAAPGALPQIDRFFFNWGVIPACVSDEFGASEIAGRNAAAVCGINHPTASVFYSMFIHGGWLHLVGNMIFLWVFGDNVEDALGHIRYALFYLVVGLAATAAQVATNQDALVPAIGASGAIAGVLAAYLVLYPRATVVALVPFIFFIPLQVPAVLLIGLWFLMQLFNGLSALTSSVAGATGGVAWFAHIGGFVAGLVLVKLFVIGRRVRAPRHTMAWRPSRD
jgi:membrane associated rhomboid family serine protease